MDRELPNSLFERLDRIEAALEQLLVAIRAKGKRGGTLPPQEWFSIEEAAALTGLSEDHVRRQVTSGSLPVSNQGTFEKPYYRIHRRDIDEWMMRRREAPCPAPRTKSGAYVSRHHKKG